METKEDKFISKYTEKIEVLKNKNIDIAIISDYTNLLDEYKKLSKRFTKTLKMNDKNGLSIVKNSEKLTEKVSSTVKIAKEKLMSNVVEQRKIKESYSEKLEQSAQIIKKLQQDLLLANNKIADFEAKYTQKQNTELLSYQNNDINLPQYENYTTSEFFIKETSHFHPIDYPIFIAKLTIDNIDEIKQSAQKSGGINGFYKALVKYLDITFGKNTKVFYSDDNLFYIIFQNYTQDQVLHTIEKLNINKKFSGIILKFLVGITKYKINLGYVSVIELLNKILNDIRYDSAVNVNYKLG